VLTLALARRTAYIGKMERSDVIILGGGLVGLALAAALDASGLCVAIVDPADPDTRTGAGFDGARQRAVVLVEADVRHGRDQRPFPEAGRRSGGSRSPTGLPRAGSPSTPATIDEPLGWMYENRHLRAALRGPRRGGQEHLRSTGTAARAVDRGEHGVTVSLEDGRELRAPLLVAAEGRNSPTREAAGIRVARWKYDHAAIVSTLRHDLPHDHVAHEIFYPAGPFALAADDR
jgi:2-octaprenyl-6-methoxyphenol hydroxylase